MLAAVPGHLGTVVYDLWKLSPPSLHSALRTSLSATAYA